MSDEQNQDQEKTEQPTSRRREQAREKGQVAKSQEITSVAILMACLTLFYFSSAMMVEKMMGLMRWTFHEAGQFVINADTIHLLILTLIYKTFGLLAPLMLTVVCVALIANVSQVGFLVSSESIQPKLSKIDPIKGFKRLFSARSFVELIKNIFKILIIGFIAYITVVGEIKNIIPLGEQSIGGVLNYIGKVAFKVMLRSCWVLVVLAVLDYIFQRWELEKSLKMSKQELKDEFKQTEGDPLIKARIKNLQREAARKRMMAQVPKADVVITNPTHIAVALKYDQSEMSAPKVIAKGRGYIAAKIKEIAEKNNVPIVENKPLAQVLYKIVDNDHTIPTDLYKAVAEVLAFVYRMKMKRSSGYSRQ
jgi:flagellar biosynthetic protein FlhB